MGQLVYSMFVSLVGYIATPDGGLDWSFPDAQVHRFVNDQARELGASLYGRRLYELMAAYWPTVEEGPGVPEVEVDFARVWRATPRIVFSRTLEQAEWSSRLVRENAAEEVARLKEQVSGDMEVGGPTLAAELIRHGLVDEYRMFVFPVVLGRGLPFFPALDAPLDLHLVETRAFDSGVVYLRHRI